MQVLGGMHERACVWRALPIEHGVSPGHFEVVECDRRIILPFCVVLRDMKKHVKLFLFPVEFPTPSPKPNPKKALRPRGRDHGHRRFERRRRVHRGHPGDRGGAGARRGDGLVRGDL